MVNKLSLRSSRREIPKFLRDAKEVYLQQRHRRK
jgi:hypothetical protein